MNNEWEGSSVTLDSRLYRGLASRPGMAGEPVGRTNSTSNIKPLHGAEVEETLFRKIDDSLSSASIDLYGSAAFVPFQRTYLLTCSSCSSKCSNPSPAKSGFQSFIHNQYRSNALAYDQSLLQKLGPRRDSESTTPRPKLSLSTFSSFMDYSPASCIAYEHWNPPQLKALSLPIITSRPNLPESPLARWAESPTAMSPGKPYPRSITQELRPLREGANYDRPRVRPRGPGSVASLGDDASTVVSVDSYGQRISAEHDREFQMEETGFRRLHITECNGQPEPFSPGVAAGQKRRASSPLGDDSQALHSMSSAGDLHS